MTHMRLQRIRLPIPKQQVLTLLLLSLHMRFMEPTTQALGRMASMGHRCAKRFLRWMKRNCKPRRMNPLHHQPLRHLPNQYRRGYVSMISLHGQRSWVTLR